MLHTKQKAFTLVELIVVVTILAILATIGFVSYSSYLTWVRDTNRIAQMTSLSDGLNLYSTTNDLPIPEDNVEVSVNSNLIAYQGYAGANILETINFTKWGLDPKDNTFFSYYLTRDRRYFQLMWFLEESADLTTNLNVTNSANAVNLQDRIPTVTGKKLGILTDKDNTPIQEFVANVDITSLNTTEYIAHIDLETRIQSTWVELTQWVFSVAVWRKHESCKSILDSNDDIVWVNWAYWITGWWESFKVYCDMTTDGGGWTLIDNKLLNETITSRTSWALTTLDETKWSLLPHYTWSTEPKLMVRSSAYNWIEWWLTLNVLTEDWKKYPTNESVAPLGSLWHFSVSELNWNTNRWEWSWIDVTSWRIGTVWIWSGTAPTAACWYNWSATWLWHNVGAVASCNTWVR